MKTARRLQGLQAPSSAAGLAAGGRCDGAVERVADRLIVVEIAATIGRRQSVLLRVAGALHIVCAIVRADALFAGRCDILAARIFQDVFGAG